MEIKQSDIELHENCYTIIYIFFIVFSIPLKKHDFVHPSSKDDLIQFVQSLINHPISFMVIQLIIN